MQSGKLLITAPGLGATAHSEAEVFGSSTWLWMHAPMQRRLQLHQLEPYLLRAIRARQYMLVSQALDGAVQPVAYLSWARMDAACEARYVDNPAHPLQARDWCSGDRLWLLDWVAPFGHSMALRSVVAAGFAGQTARCLSHHSWQRGQRVLTFRGKGVSLADARRWWQSRPILSHRPPETEAPHL